MRPWRNRRCSLVLLVIIWITIFYLCWKSVPKEETKWDVLQVLWWTKNVAGKYEIERNCGHCTCSFSNKRAKHAEATALLFYGSDIKIAEMPLPRRSNQVWALLHDESPRNTPFMPHIQFLSHFNYTSTFSRHSDYPLTTQYLPHLHYLTTKKYIQSFNVKNSLTNVHTFLSPIVFLQSDCDTLSGRDDYVRELMRYIQVDSYGKCLKNRDLPKNLEQDYLNNLYSADLLSFLGKYKFVLSIENAVCYDYVTEKFWRPLIVGSVPIYFGSPTAKDWQPNNKSVIYIEDFRNPKDLAAFIEKIVFDETEYNAYMTHKLNHSQPITNTKLLNAITTRYYSMAENNLFEAFECFVCRSINGINRTSVKVANMTHYDCPLPPIYPPMQEMVSNRHEWKSIMAVGRCYAEVLDLLWARNVPYSKTKLDQLLTVKVAAGHCD